MWISKDELNAMLAFEYTRGWNHAYVPPQEYTQWADNITRNALDKISGFSVEIPQQGIPESIINAFKEVK